jgi:hypothetical protein
MAWDWLLFGDRFCEADFDMILLGLMPDIAFGNALTLSFMPCTFSSLAVRG